MMHLTKAAILFLGLVSSVKAGVFDKNFLIRIEDITNTNKELTETIRNLSETNNKLSETNRELNATVVEQKTMMANLNTTIQLLAGKLYYCKGVFII